MLKEILKKVNYVLVEIIYIEIIYRRLSRLENKVGENTNKEININTIEEVLLLTLSFFNGWTDWRKFEKWRIFRENGKYLFLYIIIIWFMSTVI